MRTTLQLRCAAVVTVFVLAMVSSPWNCFAAEAAATKVAKPAQANRAATNQAAFNAAAANQTAGEQLVREAPLAEVEGNSQLALKSCSKCSLRRRTCRKPIGSAEKCKSLANGFRSKPRPQAQLRDGIVAEHRKRLENLAPDVDEQIALARWCRTAGLKVEERGHLLFALDRDPKSKEAITKLGLVRYGGHLVTPAQIEQFKTVSQRIVEAGKKWNPKLYELRQRFDRRDGNRDEVLAEIRKIRDIAAIPFIERTLGTAADSELALAAVDAQKAIPKQEATESLVRFVIYSGDDEVRQAAADGLRYREWDNFMPLLLDGLQAPIEAAYDNYYDTDWSAKRSILVQAGPVSDNVLIQLSNVDVWSKPAFLNNRGVDRQQQIKAAVDDANARNEIRNKKLYVVLANLTNEQRDPAPQNWWDWWFEQNEYYEPPIKPTNIQTRFRVSCFVRGTPVWTSSGPMPIEKIKPGEAVLAQDPQTGELSFKPVLATTTRPPSPTVEIRAAGGTIRGTRGHPFWISGEGWRMAKKLRAGQLLHTATGPVSIDSAEPSADAECFNLVVADCHDYFIGDAKVLVHDNTLRGPNLNRVPGLTEDE